MTRDGASWLVSVVELAQSAHAHDHRDIVERAYEMIAADTGLAHHEIDLVVCSERDSVRNWATQLGFDTTLDGGSRIDTYQLRSRWVSARYDDYGAVVGIDASSQVAEFHATRDGAFDALFYIAQYSDVRRRRLRKESP